MRSECKNGHGGENRRIVKGKTARKLRKKRSFFRLLWRSMQRKNALNGYGFNARQRAICHSVSQKVHNFAAFETQRCRTCSDKRLVPVCKACQNGRSAVSPNRLTTESITMKHTRVSQFWAPPQWKTENRCAVRSEVAAKCRRVVHVALAKHSVVTVSRVSSFLGVRYLPNK